MLKGYSIFEELSEPSLEATEFCLHDGNLNRRVQIVDSLRPKVKKLSAHLPSFMHVDQIEHEISFDDGRVDNFVAHVTKRATLDDDWKNSWKRFNIYTKKVLFENHNQDWHPTDQGICWPEQFKGIVDAGYALCLDVGHILYACSFYAGGDHSKWIDLSEKTFDGFIDFPIAQVHVHTVNQLGGPDHELQRY